MKADLSGATDLYAVGCILYEMVVGQTPFDGRTIVEIFEAHSTTSPNRRPHLVPDCPADLSDLVMQLLGEEPGRPARRRGGRPIGAGRHPARPPDAARPRPAEELAADLAAAIHPDKPNLTARLQSPAATHDQRHAARCVGRAHACRSRSDRNCSDSDRGAIAESEWTNGDLAITRRWSQRRQTADRYRFSASRAFARSSSVVQPFRSASSKRSCCTSCGSRAVTAWADQERPGPAVFERHAAGHRGVAVEHLGRHRPFAHLRKRLAEAVLARVQQVADPPRPGPLAPQRELQRPLPIGDLRLAADPHAHRRKVKRSD